MHCCLGLERLQLLIDQYMTKENGTYTCSICCKHFRDKFNARLHLDSCHFPCEEGYCCELCYQVVKTLHALNTHKKKFHKWSIKDKCWEFFLFVGLGHEARLQMLAEQYLTKVNGSYLCSICSKNCRDKYNARLHLDTCHFPPEDGYSCEVCFQVVKNLKALIYHKSKYHK